MNGSIKRITMLIAVLVVTALLGGLSGCILENMNAMDKAVGIAILGAGYNAIKSQEGGGAVYGGGGTYIPPEPSPGPSPGPSPLPQGGFENADLKVTQLRGPFVLEEGDVEQDQEDGEDYSLHDEHEDDIAQHFTEVDGATVHRA